MNFNLKCAESSHSSNEEDSFDNINKDIIKYIPAKVLGMIMNLVSVPIYTQLLLPGEYGLYGIAVGFLSFMAIVFSDWVGLSALRFFREYFKTDKIEQFFSSIIFLLLFNLLVMYILTFAFADKFINSFKLTGENFYLVLLLMIPVALRSLMFQILRSQIKPMLYTIVVTTNQFTTILAAVVFIKFLDVGSTGILLGMMVSIATIDIILILVCKLGRSSKINLISKDSIFSFYRYGIPVAATSLGMWIITQSNKFIMQYFKGAEYNAFTGVGYSLTFSLLFPLFAIITLAGIPRIINRYESGLDVRETITRLSGYFIMVFFPVVFLMCCFPEQIVLLFSNEKYIYSAQIIPFLAISAMFYGLTEYTVIQYHLIKKTYIHMLIKVLPNIFGIFLTIFLIQFFNDDKTLIAVGASALIAQLIYFIATLIFRVKDLNWIPPYKVIKNCAISIVLGFLAMLIFNALIFKFIVFSLIYVFAMLKLSRNNKTS